MRRVGVVAARHFSGLGQDEEPSLELLTAYVTDIEPILRDDIESLRALPAPKGDKKQVKKIYKLVEKAVDTIVDDPGVVLTGPNPFAKADKAGQKYGFQYCGAGAA